MKSTLDYILTKYNITVANQYLIDVPIVGGEGLAGLFAELGFTKGVEIGTDQGEYAEVLLNTIPDLDLWCIDPWKAIAYEENQQPESRENQDFFDNRYRDTIERLMGRIRCRIYRTTSMEALNIFEDNSLDFVYIDGNHDFLNVTQDMHYWLKKLRKGGILSGHDFVRYPSRKFNHVQKVVNAYSQSYHLLPVFLTDSTDEGLRRDRFRSWFLIK